MEIINIIKKRKSVRCFKKEDTISKHNINLILESAKWAPSARNLQPIEYIIIKDKKIKKELSTACCQNQPEQVPLIIAVVGNLNISKQLGKISTHNVTTGYKGTHVFIYMDAAAAIQNMLLTATSLDIDSLWISSFDEKKIYRILKLPKNYIPLAILCFGHRLKPPFTPQKRNIKDRLYVNHFKNKQQDHSYLEECKLINEKGGGIKKIQIIYVLTGFSC